MQSEGVREGEGKKQGREEKNWFVSISKLED